MAISKSLILRTAGLSAIAGMRSMSGPALLAMDERAITQTKIGEKLFGSNSMRIAVQACAIGEILFDKLPIMPNRTDLLPLLARAASGALIGASLYSAEEESSLTGALVGSVSAVAAAALSYQARKILTGKLHIPDILVAMAEDTLVISRGLKMLEASQ